MQSEGIQFHPYQCLEIHDWISALRADCVRGIGRDPRLICMHLFVRDQHMNPATRAWVVSFQKHRKASNKGRFEIGQHYRPARRIQVFPAKQNIYVLCIADATLINRCDPSSDCMSTDDRVTNFRLVQCRCDSLQLSFNSLHACKRLHETRNQFADFNRRHRYRSSSAAITCILPNTATISLI